MENILAWLPQPLFPVLLEGLGAKEKKKKKTGCGYAVVMATEACRFEPPHPATGEVKEREVPIGIFPICILEGASEPAPR